MIDGNTAAYLGAMLQLAKLAQDVGASELQISFIEEAENAYEYGDTRILKPKMKAVVEE